jgi:hypothetical protein
MEAQKSISSGDPVGRSANAVTGISQQPKPEKREEHTVETQIAIPSTNREGSPVEDLTDVPRQPEPEKLNDAVARRQPSASTNREGTPDGGQGDILRRSSKEKYEEHAIEAQRAISSVKRESTPEHPPSLTPTSTVSSHPSSYPRTPPSSTACNFGKPIKKPLPPVDTEECHASSDTVLKLCPDRPLKRKRYETPDENVLRRSKRIRAG